MGNCRFCDSPGNNFETECNICGFESKKEYFDKYLLQKHCKSKKLPERYLFMYKVHKYFTKKGRWTQKNLAELFGVSPAQVSISLKNAKNIEAGIIINDQNEQHLQNHIYSQWQILFKEWELLENRNQGKYNTNAIGEIDFLAKHKTEKERYMVIELKKGGLLDSCVGQILRYMGWVKNNLAKEKGKVDGIIIVGEAIQE
jgi:hypothetical protein